ncbi:fimbria/pilus outer membrane usher protein [Conchiformibius steedae]|uniref:Fimbrial biogenesis outer membrane usher protein n=1 Tax=Conchiformibius steedae TaxID=153493 RepID=A0A3P2A6Z3_9NEIS|nr:fimbria/pilus outer membrane usher protein [Conchiformibius steedae]RRD91187.1 fimbrial biogenesis outer membrane usher protein [Conchiformibius steedae]
MRLIRLFFWFVLVGWLLLLPFARAEEVEFDANHLQQIEGAAPVDVSRFRFGNPITAGEYTADIYVNKQKRGEALLRFTETDAAPINGLCLHREWLDLLDLLPEAVKIQPDAQNCVSAVEALPQISLEFDTSAQRLNVSVPQVLTVKRPRGYIAPSQWQNGIPTAFVRYSFHSSNTKNRQNDTRSQRRYLNLRTGANWNGWALRHQGTYTDTGKNGSDYRRYETYVERDVDRFNSRITAGDFTTRSNWNDNIGLRGVMWSSDLRMLPLSQRGFAPTVRGTADSNATVSIRQNGNVIYRTEVAAGPFVIDDLYPSGGLGDLEVEINEEDGRVRRFTVPFSSSASLVRPGQIHFQTALGRYRENENVFKLPVFQGSLQYGINNRLTLNAALDGSKRYIGTRLGTVWHTPAGTLENSLQFSQLRHPESRRRFQSKSVGLNLYKNLPGSGTYFNFGLRHYLSRYHYDIRDAAYAEQNRQWQPDTLNNNLKTQYRLSVNQTLGSKFGHVYINGISNRYYNRSRLHNEYQIGYSNQYKNLQYRLGYSQARGEANRRNNQFYFSLSLPLDTPKTQHNTQLSADYQRTDGRDTTRIALNGSYGKGSYGVAASQQNGLRNYSAHASYPTPWAKLNAHIGRSRQHHYTAYSVSGAWVAHRYGLTASPELSDTFAVIHAKGAGGALINGGNRLDRKGNGIVPHLTPYQVNKVSINPEHLPDTVELSATGMELIPRANTSTLASFTTTHGQLVLFELEAKEAGQPLPPFGTEVTDDKGRIVGHVVQGNRALVRLNDDKGTLQITWAQQHGCRFPYHLQTADSPSKQAIMPNYTVQCQAVR